MESQLLLDALTDHLAIYHRSTVTKTESRERQRVVEWLSGLSYEQRQAALTVVDGPWVTIFLSMQKYLKVEGPCSFFLLPDVPVVGRERLSVELKVSKQNKAKSDTNIANGKTTCLFKQQNSNGSKGLDQTDKTCTCCSLTLPDLCFRRARGLIRRKLMEQGSGDVLLKSIRIFSTADGESKLGSANVDVDGMLDCITVTEDLIRDMDTFLAIMDHLSNHEFLKTPCNSPVSPWEEMPWLKDMGYYSLPSFIVNKFEFGLWSAWKYAQGTKRPPRSLALKFKEAPTSRNGKGCSCDLHSSAAMASSIFGRKKGCMNWWNGLASQERANIVKCTLASACKSEVLNLVAEAKAVGAKVHGLKARGKSKLSVKNWGERNVRGAGRASLSDSEAERLVMFGRNDVKGAAIAPLFTGLQALREMSESGLLSGRFEGMNSVQEADASWMFDSTLSSAHTLSDRVLRKVRNVLVKVRNDRVELELLGDEHSGKFLSSNGGGGNEVKSTKTKKKRRKHTSAHKAEKLKHAEENSGSKSELPKGHQESEDLVKSLEEAELPVQSLGEVKQLVNGSKSAPNTQRSCSRKAKGGKSKSKKDVKMNHELSMMLNGVSSPSTLETITDHVKSENGKGSAVKCDGALSIVCPLETNQACKGELEIEVMTAHSAHDGDHSSGCSNLNIYQDQEFISLIDKVGMMEEEDRHHNDEVPFERPTSLVKASNGCIAENHLDDLVQGSVNNGEPSVICFGTIDTPLPELERHSEKAVLLKSPSECMNPTPSYRGKGKKVSERSRSQTKSEVHAERIDHGGWSEGGLGVTASHSRQLFSAPKGIFTPTKTSRQLEFGSGPSHYQQGPFVRPVAHEWPGSVEVGYAGAYHQPTATDWLQLDVGHGWAQRVQPSLVTYRRTPVPRQQIRQPEIVAPRAATTQSNSAVNQDWPSSVQPYNIPPALPHCIVPKGEPRLSTRHIFNVPPLTSGFSEAETNGGPTADEVEFEDRLAYDTDVDDYGVYKAGELDDLDGYMISEEEGEKSLEDATEGSAADYNQIFGGGVMYWNAADYAGMGYSRPGSLSSEDSSWARHEADLSVVLDDIVNYQLLQGSYPGKGSTVANVTSSSPSPPPPSSLPISCEHLSPVASTNPRHGLLRPAGNDFSGKFAQLANQGLTADEQSVVSRVSTSLEVMEEIRADSSTQPILRPIVVVRDLSLSGEAIRLQEAKSPHIVPRSRRDFPGHRKRPPSPVLRCVPPAPPPPPPSPVAGPRRRKGFMTARSGSSSPRHWGLVNWSYKDEPDGLEGKAKGGNPEGLPTGGRRRGCVSNTPPMYPLSGALLRERLISVPPLALEQEHPDLALPMKTTLLHNSDPAFHLALPKLLKALHGEIEAFRNQVENENNRRKPFVDTAFKKVAHSLQVLWPRSRTKIFGSIATGLALPTSDVDLVVCLPPVRNLEPIKEAGILEGRNGIKETCLQHAARYLADQDWVKNDSLKTIENTLVPIIILVAEFLPHQCEIGDEDSNFLLGPNIRKDTSEHGEMGDLQIPGALSSLEGCREVHTTTDVEKGLWGGKADRQLVRLDISFEAPSHTGLRTAELVRELIGLYPALSPLALVLKQFLTDRSLDHPYTGGLSSYCLVLLITRFLQHQQLHIGRQPASQNLGRLFLDFLHFFGCVFDPRRMGIRIRSGGMYVSRDRYHGIDPLYIEDPLYPDNNVGRNCFRILQCVKAFADAYAVLEKKLHEVSIGSVELGNGADNFELLQTILPGLVNT